MSKDNNVGMVGIGINRIIKNDSSKRNSKKGFTLVELIVVLVVMAVLAAAVVPAMLGYTDHAKNKKYIATAEECLKASQAVLSDRYNDSSNMLTKAQRYSAASSANVDPEGTVYKVWTAKKLEAGKTAVTADNLGAYTIVAAIFATGSEADGTDASEIKYVFYDGKDYTVYDSKEEAYNAAALKGFIDSDTGSNNRINMWPYVEDSATPVTVVAAEENWEDEQEFNDSKTVTFHIKNNATPYGVTRSDKA